MDINRAGLITSENSNKNDHYLIRICRIATHTTMICSRSSLRVDAPQALLAYIRRVLAKGGGEIDHVILLIEQDLADMLG